MEAFGACFFSSLGFGAWGFGLKVDKMEEHWGLGVRAKSLGVEGLGFRAFGWLKVERGGDKGSSGFTGRFQSLLVLTRVV